MNTHNQTASTETLPSLPVLLGRLSLEVRRGRPYLTLSVRCPHCRGLHHHQWGTDVDGPTHRHPHCWRAASPFISEGGYCIAPEESLDNANTLKRYAELLATQPPARPATASMTTAAHPAS